MVKFYALRIAELSLSQPAVRIKTYIGGSSMSEGGNIEITLRHTAEEEELDRQLDDAEHDMHHPGRRRMARARAAANNSDQILVQFFGPKVTVQGCPCGHIYEMATEEAISTPGGRQQLVRIFEGEKLDAFTVGPDDCKQCQADRDRRDTEMSRHI